MADMVMNYENNDEVTEVTEKRESPAVNFLKKFGIGAILVFAGYGMYSAVKDCAGAITKVKEAGGLKKFKAQQDIEREKAKEAKDNNKKN